MRFGVEGLPGGACGLEGPWCWPPQAQPGIVQSLISRICGSVCFGFCLGFGFFLCVFVFSLFWILSFGFRVSGGDQIGFGAGGPLKDVVEHRLLPRHQVVQLV